MPMGCDRTRGHSFSTRLHAATTGTTDVGGSPLAGTDWVTSSEECEQTLAKLEHKRLARPAVRADELSGERAGPRRLRARRLTANFDEPRVREPLTDRRRQVRGPAVARPDYRRVAPAELG